MIERCNYCGERHETEPEGGSLTFGDIPMKVCPSVEQGKVWMFNPEAFQTDRDRHDIVVLENLGFKP